MSITNRRTPLTGGARYGSNTGQLCVASATSSGGGGTPGGAIQQYNTMMMEYLEAMQILHQLMHLTEQYLLEGQLQMQD